MDRLGDCHIRKKKNGVAYIVNKEPQGLEWRTARNVATRVTSRISKHLSTYKEVVAS